MAYAYRYTQPPRPLTTLMRLWLPRFGMEHICLLLLHWTGCTGLLDWSLSLCYSPRPSASCATGPPLLPGSLPSRFFPRHWPARLAGCCHCWNCSVQPGCSGHRPLHAARVPWRACWSPSSSPSVSISGGAGGWPAAVRARSIRIPSVGGWSGGICSCCSAVVCSSPIPLQLFFRPGVSARCCSLSS